MRPNKEQVFYTEACFDNASFFLVRNGWLTKEELHVVLQLDLEYEVILNTILLQEKNNSSSLSEPHLEYEDQEETNLRSVLMHSSCLVHYGLDFWRYLTS